MASSSDSVRGDNRRLNRAGIRLVALLLAALCLICIVHGIRAGVAQGLYFRAKFGSDREDLGRIVHGCKTACRLYPANYYFAMWTAETAYYRWEADKGLDHALEAARKWCDAGLRVNHYRSSLRLLKMRLLRMDSTGEATTYWQEYVDWHFWNPHNHAVLAELYADSGRWGKAMQELRWVKGSPYYEHTRRTINGLWREQMKPPEIP